MSQLFSARELCTESLRLIGSVSVNDSAADPEELSIALRWLDLEAAELAGTQTCFWLIPAALSIPLTGGQKAYDLDNTLGADTPDDGIQFPVSATVKTGTNAEHMIDIIHRLEYDAIPDKDRTGLPEKIYLDRLEDLKMYTWPVLGAGVTGATVELTVQTFAPDFRGNGQKATGFRAAWQKWAINKNAYNVGRGPVRRLPRSETADLKKDAEDSLMKLNAFENRQHTSRPRQTPFYNGI